jgi:Zn-dependent protease with chaperone function
MAEAHRESGASMGAGDPSPPPLPPAEREDFIAAQRRHRVAARGYAVLSGFAIALQGLPFGLVVSPLLIGVAVLVVDVINLVVPVPDPLAAVATTLAGGDVTTAALAVPALLLPGSAWLVSLWWVIHRRVLRTGGASVLQMIDARDPTDDLAERQWRNVVQEMAIAAALPAPAVKVLDSAAVNAAAIGTSVDDAEVVVTRGLLDACNRAETQAVAGHLIAVIGNGDLRIGHAVLAYLMTYNLARALLLWPFDRGSRRLLAQVWRALRRSAAPSAEGVAINALTSRFLAEEDDINPVLGLPAMIIDLAWGVLQFISNLFIVGPLLALPWRRRRYLADATAVQLTRLPDALARALGHMVEHDVAIPGAGCTAPLFITGTEANAAPVSFGEALGIGAPLHPPLHKRLERLHRMGAMPRGASAAPAARRAGIVAYVLFGVLATPLVVALLLTVCALVYICVLLGLLVIGLLFVVTVLPAHAFLRGL